MKKFVHGIRPIIRHEVATLLMKGSRDTVVAGCQAEDFLINGLKDGRRVLLEFKGLGHDMSVGNLYEWIRSVELEQAVCGAVGRFHQEVVKRFAFSRRRAD